MRQDSVVYRKRFCYGYVDIANGLMVWRALIVSLIFSTAIRHTMCCIGGILWKEVKLVTESSIASTNDRKTEDNWRHYKRRILYSNGAWWPANRRFIVPPGFIQLTKSLIWNDAVSVYVSFCKIIRKAPGPAIKNAWTFRWSGLAFIQWESVPPSIANQSAPARSMECRW